MSVMPDNASGMPEEIAQSSPVLPLTRTWQSRLLGLCVAIFTFEIGLFLVIFPWMDDTWNINYLRNLLPLLRNVWEEPYFRGALTGVGLVNIYISCLEVMRLFRRT